MRSFPSFLPVGLALTGGFLLSAGNFSAAAAPARDNAANAPYADGWQSGDNGGTGFTAWDLTNNNNNNTSSFSGYFIGNSTDGSGNINTGSNASFGIYANPGNSFATAQRSFSGGALITGETFSLQIAVNNRNGSKGFNLRSGGTDLFGFNVSSDNYFAGPAGSAVSLGLNYQSDSVFTLTFRQLSATMEGVTITRTSAAGGTETALNNATFALAGVDTFQFYNSNTDNGVSQNNLYFNNLQVIPEPSALALCGVALLGLVGLHRRQRRLTADASLRVEFRA